jgi:hypothetical protein
MANATSVSCTGGPSVYASHGPHGKQKNGETPAFLASLGLTVATLMKVLKNILVRVLLVTFSLVVGLFLIELAVRLFGLYTFPQDDFVQPHPELGWAHIPNREGYWSVGESRIPVRINSKGLRDKEYPYEKKKGIFRILILGDSFTEAFQVPLKDTFCKVLERRLNAKANSFEVINAGFGGVGTDYEVLVFRHEGYKYNPDLVLLAFFPNDIYDNYKSESILDDKNSSLYYEDGGLFVRLKQFLADNSCAFNYLGPIVVRRVPLLGDCLVAVGLLGAVPTAEAEGDIHFHYLVLKKQYGAETKRAWDVTKVLFAKLGEEIQKQGSKLAVISIPFREQVYEDLWNAKLSKLGSETAKWDLGRPDRKLSKMLVDVGIPFLQLLPDFRKAAESSELYYTKADGHWNINGHHLAGQLIFDWLVREKLVPFDAARVESSTVNGEQ